MDNQKEECEWPNCNCGCSQPNGSRCAITIIRVRGEELEKLKKSRAANAGPITRKNFMYRVMQSVETNLELLMLPPPELPEASMEGFLRGRVHPDYNPTLKPGSINIITDDRAPIYGHPSNNFRRISVAREVIGECKDPEVRHALDMIWVKVCRLIEPPDHKDSLDDIEGYAETIRMIHAEREVNRAKEDKDPASVS